MKKRRTKSQVITKWAKKRGVKLIKIKLVKMKPMDLRGFPTPHSWGRILSARDPVQAVKEAAGNAVATEFEHFLKLK